MPNGSRFSSLRHSVETPEFQVSNHVLEPSTLAQVEQEHRRQASGRVDSVGPGHGKGATVLLSAHYEAQPQGTMLTLRVVDVRTTEILGMARVETGPHTAEAVLIDMAVRRLDQLLQNQIDKFLIPLIHLHDPPLADVWIRKLH